jgi:quinol monooxygenase YgiN
VEPLAVLAEFLVSPAFAERFGELVVANAEAALKRERGCRRFDVPSGSQDPRRFVLYEIYDDEGAFDLHLRSRHYHSFAAANEGKIEERSVPRLFSSMALPRRPTRLVRTATKTSHRSDRERRHR